MTQQSCQPDKDVVLALCPGWTITYTRYERSPTLMSDDCPERRAALEQTISVAYLSRTTATEVTLWIYPSFGSGVPMFWSMQQ